MANIGKLNWILGANSDKLQKDFAQTISAAKKFAGEMGGILSNLGKNMLMGGGVSGSFSDMINDVKGALASIPAIGPALAAGLGGATSLLKEASDRFKELRSSAVQFNTDIKGAAFLKTVFGDNLMAVHKFQTMLADASTGSDTARKQFEKLGLSWEQLSTMPMDKVVYELAKRFNELGTHQERVNFANEIAGKQWPELFEILSKGTGHLDKVNEKLEKMYSPAQIARMQAMDNLWKEINKDWEEFKLNMSTAGMNLMAGDVGGALKMMMTGDTLEDKLKKMREFKPSGITDFTNQTVKATAELSKMADQQDQWAKAVGGTLDQLNKQVLTLGMTANEVKLYELQMTGATDSQLRFAKSAMNIVDATKGALDFTKGLEAALPWNQKGDWKAFQMPEVPVKNNLQAAQVGTVEGESYVRRLSREAEAKNLNDELSKQTANNTAEVVKILRRIERKDKELVDI